MTMDLSDRIQILSLDAFVCVCVEEAAQSQKERLDEKGGTADITENGRKWLFIYQFYICFPNQSLKVLPDWSTVQLSLI